MFTSPRAFLAENIAKTRIACAQRCGPVKFTGHYYRGTKDSSVD